MTDDPHKSKRRALQAGLSVALIAASIALTAVLIHGPQAPAAPHAIGNADGVPPIDAPKLARPAALVIPKKKTPKKKTTVQTTSNTSVAQTQTQTVTPTRTYTPAASSGGSTGTAAVKKKSTSVPADTEFGPG